MDIGKVVLIGAGGYLLYKMFLSGESGAAVPAPTPTPTPAPSPTPTPSPSPSPTPTPVPGPAGPTPVAFNSLDSIYSRLAAAVGSTPYTADQFNFFLARELPAGVAPPDPLAVFNASGNWDRTVPMTLANYWGQMAPYLRANLGLSGLGVFGGLGALVRVH